MVHVGLGLWCSAQIRRLCHSERPPNTLCHTRHPHRAVIQQLAAAALAQPASDRPRLMATAQATVLSSISGNLAGMREEYLSAISNTLPQVSRFIITSRGEWCCLPADGGPCVRFECGKTCVAQVATIGGQAVCAAACGKNHWSRCNWCACMPVPVTPATPVLPDSHTERCPVPAGILPPMV